MANKKAVAAVDARIEAIVREEYSDFEQYLPMLQDRAMYRRKQNEYWEKINARVKEELTDGRTADSNE